MIKTDWERYYHSPMPTAFWSRAVIRKNLLKMIAKTGLKAESSVAELGGGGSCFCAAIRKKFKITNYTVYDSCQGGITAFLRKYPHGKAVCTDLLNQENEQIYDLVFSVGLIEHFQPEQTAQIIRKHFTMTKQDGCTILFFPTPTLLYRITRRIAELFGLWQFPDERPLTKEEVRKTADQCGTVLKEFTIRANFLTQHAILYRKK